MNVDLSDDLNGELASPYMTRRPPARPPLPFSRPDDFFAEMVGTDAYMERIHRRLLDETRERLRREERGTPAGVRRQEDRQAGAAQEDQAKRHGGATQKAQALCTIRLYSPEDQFHADSSLDATL
ncbi:hypothetical protein EDB89DRAFT_2073665 [Lactarius sanguifluus]|nr:hypothetical protein EDB89DRAFT_2073665 [Lactarius sanguifluus]